MNGSADPVCQRIQRTTRAEEVFVTSRENAIKAAAVVSVPRGRWQPPCLAVRAEEFSVSASGTSAPW